MTSILNRKTLLTTGVVVLVCALLAWAAWPQAQRVETAGLVRADYVRELVEDARTRVRERYTVAAPVAGQLLRPALQAGDAVQAGEVVAQILPASPSLLDARSQGEQAERVAAMQASLARAQAQHRRALTLEQQALTELQRQQALAAQGFISPAQLDGVQLALQQRQQESAMALQEVRTATHDLQRLRIGLAPPSPEPQAASGQTLWSVRAPITGRVLKLHHTSAGPVTAGTPLLELGDPARLEIVTELLTEDAQSVPAQARATLGLWGTAKQWPARLLRIEPGAFTRVSALGVQEQRTLAVFEWLAPVPPGLGDGYRLDIRIVMEEAQQVLLAPVSSVFAHGSGHAVFVVEGRRVRLQPVEQVSRNGEYAWLRTTLAPDTRLVAYPPTTLKDGDRVQPAPETPASRP
jgi:HlyD family secretion protein